MLGQNPLLLEIVDKLTYKEPARDEVIKRFKDQLPYITNKSENGLLGRLSEICLRVSLEDICNDYNGRVVFDPIANKAEVDHYLFKKNGLGMIIFDKNSETYLTDIDELILVDQIPALFEIKLARYKSRGRGKRSKGSPGCLGITHVIRNKDKILQIIEPIKRLFNSDSCGYVLVISADQIKPDSPLQKDFRDSGGLLVPFYTNKDNFYREYLLDKSWLREY